jgi:hypothetical protein
MSPSKTESNYPMNTDPIPSKHLKKNMKISIFTFKTNEKKKNHCGCKREGIECYFEPEEMMRF